MTDINDINETLDNDNGEKLDALVSELTALTEAAQTVTDGQTVAEGQTDAEPADGTEFDDDADGFDGVNIVSLFDEEGNQYEFELIDYVDYNDKLYAILMPAELSGTDDEEVVVMETYFEGNEPNFLFVDDEQLAQQILDAYSAREDG